MQNPFTLSFGVLPEQLISRPAQKNEIIDMFREEKPSNRTYMITGVRGSGKTVMLTEIQDYFREKRDWITIELNPEADMLRNLASGLFHADKCHQWFINAKFNVSVLGIGFSVENEPITSDEVLIRKMLAVLEKHGIHLLISVDEASDSPYMRQFAHAYQMFLRERHDIFLLMTGLYENIYDLQNVKTLTFLYRAPKISLTPLNFEMIAKSYYKVFGVEDKIATAMAKMTEGYPFAYQVLGFLKWENPDKSLQDISDEFDHYLAEYVYDKIWSGLTGKEKKILTALAALIQKKGNAQIEIKSIREETGLKTNEMSVYRDRLIRKGLVDGSNYGSLRLTLPGFDRYIKQRALFENMTENIRNFREIR